MTLQTELNSPVVRPVFAGYLNITGDPIYAWTGPGALNISGTGDTIIDSNTFLSIDGAVEISDFKEGVGASSNVTLTFTAEDTDDTVLRQLIRDRRVWQLQDAIIWLFFLDADMQTVRPDFTRMFTGVIVNASTTRQVGQPIQITLDLDMDQGKAQGAGARLVDHKRFNAGDTASDFIVPLAAGKPLTSGRRRGPNAQPVAPVVQARRRRLGGYNDP